MDNLIDSFHDALDSTLDGAHDAIDNLLGNGDKDAGTGDGASEYHGATSGTWIVICSGAWFIKY